MKAILIADFVVHHFEWFEDLHKQYSKINYGFCFSIKFAKAQFCKVCNISSLIFDVS